MQPRQPARARHRSVDTTHRRRTVPVMYNPEELKLEQGNKFAEVGIPGLNASPVQYVRGKARDADDGAVLRHLRDRRGRARPHRADRRGCWTSEPADPGAAGAAVLPRAASSSAACWSTPASGSRCSCATARRCARRCRCACRSTSSVDSRSAGGSSSARRPCRRR